MKKILFFIESLQGGGAEKVLLDLVSNLDTSKYEVYVKTISDNGIYVSQMQEHCHYSSFLHCSDLKKGFVKSLLYRVKYKLIYKLSPHLVAKMLFAKNHYDIGIAFVEGFATRIVGATDLNFNQRIAWVHVDPIERDYADTYFRSIDEEKAYYCKYNKIVCVSESVKASVKKKFGVDLPLMVLYNPIDKDNILQKANEFYLEKRTEKFSLVSVGRMEEQKGFERLIRIISVVRENYDIDCGLTILGDGSLKCSLQELIKTLRLEKHVDMPGFQTNPYPYIKNADLFVCSSIAEGYSLVVAEALVLGVPVIATNCSGPNELLENGNYGFLVDNDERSLLNGIVNILSDEEKLEAYRQKAVVRSIWFDLEQTIASIEEIFDNG